MIFKNLVFKELTLNWVIRALITFLQWIETKITLFNPYWLKIIKTNQFGNANFGKLLDPEVVGSSLYQKSICISILHFHVSSMG